MEDTQLMKGVLEGCVLAVIARGETYGYAILQMLWRAGFRDLQEGTLYPILTRLEKKGYIACRREKSPLGPIRKYFTVTPAGLNQLGAFRAGYEMMTTNVNRILLDGEGDLQ